jgi:carbon-monoxide dehydrogenase small subunit
VFLRTPVYPGAWRHAVKRRVEPRINDENYEVEVEPHWTLLEVLRDRLGLMGTKEGCGLGACGACTVIVEDAPVLSCLTLAVDVEGKSITTIEGLSKGGALHPLQIAFANHGAIQCGFCTPGAILSSKALLDRNPHPSRKEIGSALSGNLCRCTGYKKIIDAVESLVRR